MKARQRNRRLIEWAARVIRVLLWVRKEQETPRKALPAQAQPESGEKLPWGLRPLGAAEAKLLAELRSAHTEWACARHRLNYAVLDDEIDFAIYALESAEKRYGMLIKQAKLMNLRAAAAFRTPYCDPVDRG